MMLMFTEAKLFNQLLDDWNIRNDTIIKYIFDETSLKIFPKWYTDERAEKSMIRYWLFRSEYEPSPGILVSSNNEDY